MEYAPHGNLRDFLRQHLSSYGHDPAIITDLKEKKTLTQKDLVSFAYQVARGMEYLASRRVSLFLLWYCAILTEYLTRCTQAVGITPNICFLHIAECYTRWLA
jgi:serine/threonine protein kinase